MKRERTEDAESAAAPVSIEDLIPRLDAIAAGGSSHVYVEILAKPGKRLPPGSQQMRSRGRGKNACPAAPSLLRSSLFPAVA